MTRVPKFSIPAVCSSVERLALECRTEPEVNAAARGIKEPVFTTIVEKVIHVQLDVRIMFSPFEFVPGKHIYGPSCLGGEDERQTAVILQSISSVRIAAFIFLRTGADSSSAQSQALHANVIEEISGKHHPSP